MAKLEKRYPSQVEVIDLMLDDLESTLAGAGVDPLLGHRVSVAVSEAFTNAIVHAHNYRWKLQVLLRLSVNETSVIADIDDQGQNGLIRIRGKTPADELAESGRGVDLIRSLATRSDFSEREDGGLHVHLEFERATSSSEVQS